MTKLNDSTFLIITNEDIALIFSFKSGNIIFHKEFSLSSDYILPLKNWNDLISCSKIFTVLLKYKKFATYDISLKFDFPSDNATEYEDGRIFIVSKNIIIFKKTFLLLKVILLNLIDLLKLIIQNIKD